MDKIVSDTSDFTFLRYSTERAKEWDNFVRTSANGTFLMQRSYMDYHSDRFTDHSIMAFHRGKLRACLPANITNDLTLNSHGGLTYGGWILPRAHFDGNRVEQLFKAWIDDTKGEGIKRIIYKPIPWVLSALPAQEDLYALWHCGFSLEARRLSSAIFMDDIPAFNMAKRQQLRAARKITCLEIGESNQWDEFWEMLQQCLRERHDAEPVHTIDEMRLLHSRFPDNIRLFSVCNDKEMLAGSVIFECGHTAHTQYMATSPHGRDQNCLTLLIDYLLSNVYANKRIFDFGTSNLPDESLHASLLEQKYSLGARGAIYETYTLDL